MTAATTAATAAQGPGLGAALHDLLAAGEGRSAEPFRRLLGTLWDAGTLLPGAPHAIPELVGALERAGHEQRGRLALLLGLLAEADDGAAHEAVADGLERYLALLPEEPAAGPVPPGEGSSVQRSAAALPGEGRNVPRPGPALLYLLAHFPAHRDRILAATAELDLEADDRTRLDRCLRTADPADDLATRQLGRVFPSPAAWALAEEDLRGNGGWARWLALTDDQLTAFWDAESRALLAYAGAKAAWDVEHPGGLAPVAPVTALDPPGAAEPEPGARGTTTASYGGLRCPDCRGELAVGEQGLTCEACVTPYRLMDGYLDLLGDSGPGSGHSDPLFADRYERGVRAGFLRMMGSNWDGAVTPADEDRYLIERVRPADGPVLDVAAGAGRWTRVLADRFGAGRVVALDVSRAMLARLGAQLPGVRALRGSALRLPFADASLGAVNCWNALQALPDPQAAIAEIGRCLRPGGTFTALTFRPTDDPLLGYFQARMSDSAQRDTFEPELIKKWLADSGMTVTDRSVPGTFLIFTAVREQS